MFVFTQYAFSQEEIKTPEFYTAHNKGKFYIAWGGNRESYSKSDVTYTGDNYHFTVENMDAHDKPKGWHIDYLNPTRMTIPQTNFRLGYYVSDHYSVSVGWDHMKYVMTQDQIANVNGYINTGEGFDGQYNHTPTVMTKEFLTYEHTDGLNYVNAEVARHDDISKLFTIGNTDMIQINVSEGIGAGVLYPKTNTKLMGRQRHDEFHISGYGVSAKAALNITFLKYFYVQGELKGGYINMNDIRTTYDGNDRASQEFFYFQRIIQVGAIFRVF
ncbi:MAG: hypothetical protein QM717_14680 [Flavobacterium sp.]